MASKKRTLAQTQMITKTGKVKRKRAAGDYQRGREMSKGIGRELKAFDLALSQSAFTTAGVFTLLNVPVNGAEIYQRVGRKIYMKSLHLRGAVVSLATSIQQDLVRIIVFYDSQPNAAASNLATLLQDSNAAAATSGTSGINLNNRERFKIIRDIQLSLPSITDTGGVITNVSQFDQANKFSINEFIKLKGLETMFNATNGGTIADVTSGSLYLLTVSTLDTSKWQLEFQTRLRYYDT